jgi:hypothetical protein
MSNAAYHLKRDIGFAPGGINPSNFAAKLGEYIMRIPRTFSSEVKTSSFIEHAIEQTPFEVLRFHKIVKRSSRWLWVFLLLPAGVSPAIANCSSTSWSAIQPYMEGFVRDPGSILAEFPSGGDKLNHALRDFLMVDSKLVLKSVIDLVKTGNSEQKKSIGSALGASVSACKKTDPDAAKFIQAKVQKLRDQTVALAYVNALQDDDDTPQKTSLSIGQSMNVGPSAGTTNSPMQHFGANTDNLEIWNPLKQPNIQAPIVSYSR